MAPGVAITRGFALWACTCALACAQEYRFRYFGVADGLTNLGVRNLFEDRTGFLWVSTENGVFRYDGERFEPMGPREGLPLNTGAGFGDAPDGSLLVGGDFGLFRFKGARFEKVEMPASSVSWAQGIQYDAGGKTLLAADTGLLELTVSPSGDRLEVRPASGAVFSPSGRAAHGVLVDGRAIWYGCGSELCRIDEKGAATVYGRRNGLPETEWTSLRRDGAGSLWVRGRGIGVFVMARGAARFIRPDSPEPPTSLGALSVDSEGRILVPSPVGLLIHGETGWRRVGRPGGLRGTVYAAFQDRRRALWIGLAGRGLARWQGYLEWENYSSDSGLPSDVVYEIARQPDGSLWVATEGGMARGTRSAGGGVRWEPLAGLTGFAIHSVRRGPDGSIWIGTETRGAARIAPGAGAITWFDESRGLPAKAPYVLRFDRRNRLWAATDEGLFVSSPPYARFSRIGKLPPKRFWTVMVGRDGSIWAGGAGGLFHEVPGGWKNYTEVDGLAKREVISLGVRDDAVWVGYRHGGGIDRVRLAAGGDVRIEKSVQRPGDNGITYFLETDAAGRMWAGSENGVDVWNGQRWSHYDSNDGLAWDDCDLNSFAAEPDGTVWIGTSGGLSRFTPHRRSGDSFAPSVLFTRLMLGRDDVTASVGGGRAPRGRANSLTARYTILNAPTDHPLFRYRLAPVESAWTETSRRELEFAELPPGNYRLDVDAHDDEHDSAQPRKAANAAFSFEIPTPWYMTWWFRTACILTPLLVLAGALRIRALSARLRERKLMELVEAKTVDLRKANEDLLRLSSQDALTGLANRRVFNNTIELHLNGLAAGDCSVSLVLLDIDHFKALNDSQGHQRGDECLAQVGAVLRRRVRQNVDVAARYGGEEFAVILPKTDAAGAAVFAESLRAAIQGIGFAHPQSPVAPVVTVSIGVATATPERPRKPEELISAADSALYKAKHGGRNRAEVEPAWSPDAEMLARFAEEVRNPAEAARRLTPVAVASDRA